MVISFKCSKMTIFTVKPKELGKTITKFINTSFHICVGIESGCSNPIGTHFGITLVDISNIVKKYTSNIFHFGPIKSPLNSCQSLFNTNMTTNCRFMVLHQNFFNKSLFHMYHYYLFPIQ